MASIPPQKLAEGHHILVELNDCSEMQLTDAQFIENTLVKCAQEGGAKVVSAHFHLFSPHGISGVVIIAESHVTIHTWPEYNYAAIDVFTCGNQTIAQKIVHLILHYFSPATLKQTALVREPHKPARLLEHERIN